MPSGTIRGSCLAEGRLLDRSRFLCKRLHDPAVHNEPRPGVSDPSQTIHERGNSGEGREEGELTTTGNILELSFLLSSGRAHLGLTEPHGTSQGLVSRDVSR